MEEASFYYLHTNGDLIHKRFLPDPSDFVKRTWTFRPEHRESAWILVTEAAALGARSSRIEQLIKKWGLTDKDAEIFAERVGLKLFLDGDQWCAAFGDFVNIQESQCGVGPRAIDALIDLSKGGLTP